MHGGDRRSAAFQVDTDKLETHKGGTAEEYLMARIERDAPEVYDRMEAAEFATVAAAAREAGIIRQRTKTMSLSKYESRSSKQHEEQPYSQSDRQRRDQGSYQEQPQRGRDSNKDCGNLSNHIHRSPYQTTRLIQFWSTQVSLCPRTVTASVTMKV